MIIFREISDFYTDSRPCTLSRLPIRFYEDILTIFRTSLPIRIFATEPPTDSDSNNTGLSDLLGKS